MYTNIFLKTIFYVYLLHYVLLFCTSFYLKRTGDDDDDTDIDDSDEEDEDEEEEEVIVADDADVVSEEDKAYLASLEQMNREAKEGNGAAGGGDNGDGFMSGEPMGFGAEMSEFDFESSEDHFTSNLDLENHLQFFVDTLEVLQQKGEAQSISQGMDHNMTNTMNRLIQTHGRLQQFIANNNSGF